MAASRKKELKKNRGSRKRLINSNPLRTLHTGALTADCERVTGPTTVYSGEEWSNSSITDYDRSRARLHPGSLAPPRARHGAPATGVVGARTSELRARAIALPCALPLFAGRLVAKVFVERVAVLGLLLRVPASALLPAEHPLVGEKVWLEVLRIGARMPRRHLTTAAATAAAATATATTTAGSAPDLRPSPLARWEATDVAGTASTAGAGAAATVATAQSAKTSCLGARAHPPSATLRSPQGYSGICSRR